jgi:hypothetical protein
MLAVPDSSNDPQLIARLGALAVCAGFDHVSHDIADSGSYLTVSVRKQKGIHGRITTFPSGVTFVEVDIPHGHKTDYQSSDDRYKHKPATNRKFILYYISIFAVLLFLTVMADLNVNFLLITKSETSCLITQSPINHTDTSA